MTDKLAVESPALARVLENVALFASKDKARPILRELELTVEDDTLTVVATDSYALGRETVTLTDTGLATRVFRISADEARAIAKVAKADKYGLTVVAVDDHEAVFTVGAQTFTCQLGDGQYPNWKQLLTDSESCAPYALMPFQLARLAKIKTEYDSPIRFLSTDPLKPTRFTVGSTFDGLLMPVRVS